MTDPSEAQARVIIAAALIVRGAVESPTLPSPGQRLPDSAGVRLRDYVYRLATAVNPMTDAERRSGHHVLSLSQATHGSRPSST